MEYIVLIISVTAILFTTETNGITCPSSPDPCTSNTILNSADRNVIYSDFQSTNLADHSLLEGWYRAIEPAGVDLAITPPSIYACQAMAPSWLNGSMPRETDGIVERKACMVGFDEPCSYTLDICIRNCGSYNVYFLTRPSDTYSRYCFVSKSITTCPVSPDPCSNHKELNNADRNVMYSEITSTNLADHSILEGWYRAREPAGVDLATFPPPVYSCQAISPTWINGSIPTTIGSVLEGKACVVGLNNNTCVKTLDICIKNCGDYNVYFLTRPSDTYSRYCFASEMVTKSSVQTTEVIKDRLITTAEPVKSSEPSSTLVTTQIWKGPIVSDNSTTKPVPGDKNQDIVIVAVVVPLGVLFLILVFALVMYVWCRKPESKKLKYLDNGSGTKAITKSNADKYGNGIYGMVHNGKPPPAYDDYCVIADKKSSLNGIDGPYAHLQGQGNIYDKMDQQQYELLCVQQNEQNARQCTGLNGGTGVMVLNVSQYSEIPADAMNKQSRY